MLARLRGVLPRELGVDHGDRDLLGVLLKQALTELIDGVHAARRRGHRTKQPGAGTDQHS